MRPLLTLFFDTEDPYNEHADDAAKAIAEAFSAEGVRGTFCVTGEKCRKLLGRGRHDVIAALESHALGLHTNTHSIHPTTMELLESRDWEEGCRAALAAERPGLEAFERAFGRKPCCWAGAGYTWGPQITAALPELGIPSYVYSLTQEPGMRVHRFLGQFAFPIHHSVYEPNWFAADGVRQALEAVENALAHPWTGVLCGHPTRLRYTDYWDKPFYAGVTPEEYQGPPPRSAEDFDETLERLRWFVQEIGKQSRIVGLDEVLEMPWTFTPATPDEQAEAARLTTERIQRVAQLWPVHKPDLDTSLIERLTIERLDTIEIGALP
jgi:hypothetical protein